MKRGFIQALFIAALFSLSVHSQSFAVTKLDKVNVKFTVEDYDYRGFPQVEAITKESAHYQVDLCESAEEYYERGFENPYEDQTGIYVVEITTDDGYQFRFSSSDKKKINLSGMGAVFLRATQENNGHTLRLIVRLDNLDAYVGQIEYASWNGCKGEWCESEYAVGYRLRLIDSKGKYHYVETAGTSYDFAPLMLNSGIYHYDVRAISKDDKYGEWVSGGSYIVTNTVAEENKSMYMVDKINHRINEDLAHTPDNNRTEYLNTGWQKTDGGEYWYRNNDGTYPQNVWQLIEGYWYYFWGSGYMACDTYVTWKNEDYYVSSDGHMLTNDYAPDGRWSDETGILHIKENE